MKVKIERKYWPETATGDADAIEPGTVIDLGDDEARRIVALGVASIVFEDKRAKAG